ncbi:hypothetical protein SAMN05444483_105139 [Salegentibacter echinorum]|uniref:Pectate lyase superfamily protein n=1 Tax=Salegentibacter echinorum TaxID=1073325 RepID=A0A1M5HGB7_SALEC|nr:hypothetical protein [Salegentibacter echinorum]SHG15014.1 hypothetical protein SAMN05444483_105139 [Salegentibacter echinorum]
MNTRIIKLMFKQFFIVVTLGVLNSHTLIAQNVPDILKNKKVSKTNYLPDFSFAGYHWGEKQIPKGKGKIIFATDYGVIANDGLDDSGALLKALEDTRDMEGDITLQLPPGKIILSEILFIERSNFVLRGAGVGKEGTEIYCPRPMRLMKDPESLKELREYLIEFDKRQREPENNIDLPFSQYAWSGGVIWTQVPGERIKSYTAKYDRSKNVLANVTGGERGEHTLKVSESSNLKVGDVVQLELFNKDGEKGEIIKDMYKETGVKVGSHHWNFPELPIVRQQVKVVSKSGNTVKIKSPLTISIDEAYKARLVEWKHLKEVGIEHLRISFPDAPRIAHHVEEGYNGIYLTRLHNSWVDDVVIINADSGILTEGTANTTIENVVTNGDNKAHYSVAMSGVFNVLVKNLKVQNKVIHPLSFNTFSTKSVYQNCEVLIDPILDQHSGANHQNLFDNIIVHVKPKNNNYPLFKGGGAGYWKPSHGAYNTFWNINVHFLNGLNNNETILLNGMEDGPLARVIGVKGNNPIEIEYGPDAYIEMSNRDISPSSLYNYQLDKRLE